MAERYAHALEDASNGRPIQRIAAGRRRGSPRYVASLNDGLTCPARRRAYGRTAARLTMTPIGGEHALVIEKTGPWALLRLFDAPAHLDPTAQPEKFRFTLTDRAGGTARLDLNASSIRNPFSRDLLRGFRCPPAL